MKINLIQKYFFLIIALVLMRLASMAQPGWSKLTSPTSHVLYSVYCIGNTGYISGGTGQTNQNEVLKTIDGGKNWTNTITRELFYSLYFTDVNTGYAIDFYGIFKTTDGGNTWNRIYTNNDIPGYAAFSSIFFTDFNTGYFAGGNLLGPGAILKTTDGGQTWIPLKTDVHFGLNSVFFTNSNTGYAVGSGDTIIRTTNGGKSWMPVKVPAGSLNSVYFVGRYGYAVGDCGAIIKSVDGGKNWWNSSPGIPGNLVSVFFTDPINGYVINGLGTNADCLSYPMEAILFRTNNGGNTWTSETFETSGQESVFHSIFFTSRLTGYLVSNHGGIYKTVSGGNELATGFTPGNIEIYPNPNQGSFSLNFSNPEGKKVNIKIVNAEGEVVSETTNSREMYYFDNIHFRKGFYIVEIEGENIRMTQKMIVF